MTDGANLGGRPTLYTPAIADVILARLADGESLRSICRDETLPAESTVRLWVVDDRKDEGEEQGFAARYTRARDIGLDCRADRIVEEAREAKDAPLGRLVMDADRWYLSKLAPKRYGDRVAVTGADGGAVIMQLTSDDAGL